MLPANERTLYCNVISDWLGAYTKWSLNNVNRSRIRQMLGYEHTRLTLKIAFLNTLWPGDAYMKHDDLSPFWLQAMPEPTNVNSFSNGPNFSELWIKVHEFSFNNMHSRLSSNWRHFDSDVNVLKSNVHVHKAAFSAKNPLFRPRDQTFMQGIGPTLCMCMWYSTISIMQRSPNLPVYSLT